MSVKVTDSTALSPSTTNPASRTARWQTRSNDSWGRGKPSKRFRPAPPEPACCVRNDPSRRSTRTRSGCTPRGGCARGRSSRRGTRAVHEGRAVADRGCRSLLAATTGMAPEALRGHARSEPILGATVLRGQQPRRPKELAASGAHPTRSSSSTPTRRRSRSSPGSRSMRHPAVEPTEVPARHVARQPRRAASRHGPRRHGPRRQRYACARPGARQSSRG
jgi:hypothetical protein